MRSHSNSRDKMVRSPRKPRALATLLVRPGALDHRRGVVIAGQRLLRCALGRSGVTVLKRESDGGTPLASMRVLGAYFRDHPGRTTLSLRRSSVRLGWCDAPSDRNYNRPVGLPYPASHEMMRRGDALYDKVVVLDWNIRPRVRNLGSAIFLHIARLGYAPTEGCVAISARDMAWLLPRLSRRTVLKVMR